MLKRAWESIKSHFTRAEVVSFIQTAIGFMIVDAALAFERVMNGDISRDALIALLVAVGRSVFKALWNMVFAMAKVPEIKPAPQEGV